MVRIPFILIVAGGLLVAAVLFPAVRYVFVIVALVCAPIWLFWRSAARSLAEKERLRRDGTPGFARIRSIRQSSVQTKRGRYLNVELEFDLSTGGETRRVARNTPVPELHVRRLVLDAVLPVRVDPKDSSRFLIDWDAAVD